MDANSLLFILGSTLSLLFGLYLGWKNGIERGMEIQAVMDAVNVQKIVTACSKDTQTEFMNIAQKIVDALPKK